MSAVPLTRTFLPECDLSATAGHKKTRPLMLRGRVFGLELPMQMHGSGLRNRLCVVVGLDANRQLSDQL